MQRYFHRSVWLFAIAFLSSQAGVASAQAPFYQGKTIKLIVGTSAGDLYDQWARVLTPALAKNLPGNPDALVQNMPGAGHRVAANYLFTIAKPDGLTLAATILPSLYFDQLVGRKEVQFDWSRFSWIGSPVQEEHVFFVRTDTPYKTLDDIKRAAEPPKCGATGLGSTGYYLPRLFEEALGLKFNIVTGYPGGAELNLAIERGELQCRAFTITAYVADREPFNSWRKSGTIRALIQTSSQRDPRLADVPTIYELMDKEKTPAALRRVAEVILAPGAFGRPMIGPPGLPADRVKQLREAYLRALKDPAIIAYAKKLDWHLEAKSGDELQGHSKKVIDQPSDVIVRMKKILGD